MAYTMSQSYYGGEFSAFRFWAFSTLIAITQPVVNTHLVSVEGWQIFQIINKTDRIQRKIVHSFQNSKLIQFNRVLMSLCSKPKSVPGIEL